MWLVRAVGSSLWLPEWQDMHGHNYWIWAPPTASWPHPCSPSSTHLLPLWNALFHLLLFLCHPSHTPALACKGQQNSLFLRSTNVQISACPCSYLTSPNVTQMCCKFATFLWCHFYSVTFFVKYRALRSRIEPWVISSSSTSRLRDNLIVLSHRWDHRRLSVLSLDYLR